MLAKTFCPSVVETEEPINLVLDKENRKQKFTIENSNNSDKQKFTKVDSSESNTNPTFTMVYPPPNVTGSLHLGHALTTAIQDCIVRYKRMKGFDVLWIPGLDHAGIATQTVVEKQLQKEHNLTRHDLGRDAFVEKVWDWKHKYGNNILSQLKSLGASLDWDHTTFTLDDNYQKAVKEAFIRLAEKGIIYRSNRKVAWSYALRSAISSIEIDVLDVEKSTIIKTPGDINVEVGVVHYFYYVTTDGFKVMVAEENIENMLGHRTVTITMDDEYSRNLIGKKCIHPLTGRDVLLVKDGDIVNKESYENVSDQLYENIKVIGDDGTIKYEIDTSLKTRFNLEGYKFETGKIDPLKYQGMNRFIARKHIIQDLKDLGLYVEKKDKPMQVHICSRTGDIIEYIEKPQWWISCKKMAENVLDPGIKFIPESALDTWKHWLNNIEDWCISRQLWWGHRIPAYHVKETNIWIIAESLEEAKEEYIAMLDNKKQLRIIEIDVKCRYNRGLSKESREDLKKQREDITTTIDHHKNNFTITQDEDVLDTWFSSALFPFVALGWPEMNGNSFEKENNVGENNVGESNVGEKEFSLRFPTDLLETGSDILFFWVARMAMLSKELLGVVPFKTVYLHNLIRDSSGRKMSKSLGNVIDPLDVINGATLKELEEKISSANLSDKEIRLAKANTKKEFPNGIPKCGTDALRFGLLSYTKQSSDINLNINVITSARKFCNKIWQAVRFYIDKQSLLINEQIKKYLADKQSLLINEQIKKYLDDDTDNLSHSATDILSKLDETKSVVFDAYEDYKFSVATTALYNFLFKNICGEFIEACKDKSESENNIIVLGHVLKEFLELLHPIMPFITSYLLKNVFE